MEITPTVYWSDREGRCGSWVASEQRGEIVRRVVLKGVEPDEREEAESEGAKALATMRAAGR